MKPAKCPSPPSSSLPPLRAGAKLTEYHILSALENLSEIYCPLPVSISLSANPLPRIASGGESPPLDSGYASDIEGSQTMAGQREDVLTRLRADAFERDVAQRWLSGFLGRAEMLLCDFEDDVRQYAIDEAACIMEAMFAPSSSEELSDDVEDEFAHEFAFSLTTPCGKETVQTPIEIKLYDRLAGKSSEDPDDVGLQIWGASIIFSRLLCADPARFGLSTNNQPGSATEAPRIIELGAGTGLISLVLGAALPHLGFADARVVSTDYHPQVLDNLQRNVSSNGLAVDTALLDWSCPTFDAPLDKPADVLIAADVVYGPEHAILLRDCAARFLAPRGVFWMLTTIREDGKFTGVQATVQAAFAADDCPVNEEGRVLKILRSENLEKQKGVGRGDERGYRLFQIGWTDVETR